MKRFCIVLAVLLICSITAQAISLPDDFTVPDPSMPNAIEGEWTGKVKISLLAFSLPITISFFADGTYSLEVMGMKSEGTYELNEEGKIVILPETSEGINTEGIDSLELEYSLQEGELQVNGSMQGVDGDMSASRTEEKEK